MSAQSLSLVDTRVEEVFKEHMSLNDSEVSVVVNRFYELYYTRGKSLRTSINNAIVGKPTKAHSELFSELRDIVSRY